MSWSRRRKMVASICATLAVVAVAAAALVLWACGGIQCACDVDGPICVYDTGAAAEAPKGDTLVVLTWNISFAHGRGSDGAGGYTPRSEVEMARRLERIGEVIRDSGADVALLQEVDFGSDRSHHVDQLEVLAKVTGLPHAAPAVSWRANYVPFPAWPPSSHFGAVCSGGAVLSRFPVEWNRVTLHPKPESNSFFYNAFYLFRYTQHVRLRVGRRVVNVVNNHLDAYDTVSREKQARVLKQLVCGITGEGGLTIFGGDMNTAPTDAVKKHGFADEPEADFRDDRTTEILSSVPGLAEVVSPAAYRDNEESFFTFPSHAPSRRLDYIFVGGDVSVGGVRVVAAGELSDHLPVRAQLAVRNAGAAASRRH